MSVFSMIPPYKQLVDHISSNGWEIDLYSDGTWQGSMYKAEAKTYTSRFTLWSSSYQNGGASITISALPSGRNLTGTTYTTIDCHLRNVSSSNTFVISDSVVRNDSVINHYCTFYSAAGNMLAGTLELIIEAIGIWQ